MPFDQNYLNNPWTQVGVGILGGNYGRNSGEAFANAMKGGLLGMQQAGVSQARQAQTQMAQQQMMMAQAAAKKRQEEREQFEAWVSTLPPQEQAMARGNPELYKTMMTQKYQQQYAPPTAPTVAPSEVREHQYYMSLDKAGREEFLRRKRAQNFLNLGNQFAAPSMTDPSQITATHQIDIKPGEDPAVRKRQAAATAEGTAEGAAMVSYKDAAARMPRLLALAGELSALGKKATYTKAGQARDYLARQAGMDVGEGAVARPEDQSKVDNEILPLLRATFGAQFTEKEGQSLKATLGDPDKSPEEKDAVLRSFITTKMEDLKTMGRRVGVEPQGSAIAPVATQQAGKVVDFNSLP